MKLEMVLEQHSDDISHRDFKFKKSDNFVKHSGGFRFNRAEANN